VLKETIFGSPRMFGIETEFFLIDNEGRITNKAHEIISKLENKFAESSLTKECGQAMLEHITFPHTSAKATFGSFFTDFETLLAELEANDLGIFYFGTYPGKNTGLVNEDRRYKIKEKILGKKQFSAATKCIGFHFHSTLPSKSFNDTIKFFFPDINEKVKLRVLDLFNFYIAMDPAITSLMQSSPYYESHLIGKDSRAMMYRGDPMYTTKASLYEKQPVFGTLNDYAHNFEELTNAIKERTMEWKMLLKNEDASMEDFTKRNALPSMLDSSWKPVKITTHGTIEQRGSDMNYFSRILGLSSALKYVAMHIQKSSVSVVPGDIGDKEPFKEEDGILFIPGFEKIKQLEKASATLGFEDKDVYMYAKKFIDFASTLIPGDERVMLKVFRNSLDEKKTVSDEIISFVKKKQGDYSVIAEETTRDFALRSYDRLYRDIMKTKKICEHGEHELFHLPKIERFW
jgi:hypothetical protein